MDLFLMLVGAFALGGWLGYKINDIMIRHTFAEMIKEAGLKEQDLDKFIEHWAPLMEDEESEQPNSTLEITLEQQGDMIYAYRKDNSQFLAQGRDRDELTSALAKDWPGVTLLVKKEEGGSLLNG
jgi:hypothetical protein